MSNAQKLLGFAVAMLLLAGGGYLAISWLEQPPERSKPTSGNNSSWENVENEKATETPTKPDPVAEKEREKQQHLAGLLLYKLNYHHNAGTLTELLNRGGDVMLDSDGFERRWHLGGRRSRYSGSLSVEGLARQTRAEVIAEALKAWKHTQDYPQAMVVAGQKTLASAESIQFEDDNVGTISSEKTITAGYEWSVSLTDGRRSSTYDRNLGRFVDADPAVEKWRVMIHWRLPRPRN